MLTKVRLFFKWDAVPRLRLLPGQLIATIAILMAALLLAFRTNDFMVWQLTKAILFFCTLNAFRIISQTHKN